MEIIIIEQNGWKKPVTIEKAITRLGSASTNEVQLDSPQIAPVHLQLYYLDETPSNCKIFNLGNQVVVWQGIRQLTLNPYETIYIQNGNEIELGPYRIQFNLPLAATTIQASNSIQASLSFPDATLGSRTPATGWLTIKNSGTHAACQVAVDLRGLPEDCMRVDPAPLLYPGGQEEVRIQLFHRQLYPEAGFKELTITVTASDSYPGEEVIIKQEIFVHPVFEQLIEIVDDLADAPQSELPKPSSAAVVPEKPGSAYEAEPQVPPVDEETVLSARMQAVAYTTPELLIETTSELPENIQMDEVPVGEDNLPTSQEEVVTEMPAIPARPAILDLSKTKVVHNPTDDFWEKE